MSFQITEAFQQQWGNNFRHMAQQQTSRLESAVNVESNIQGETKWIGRIGATSAQKKTTRHGDTPLIETPHSMRAIDLNDYEWADLVDDLDKKKALADPTSDYLKAGVAAMNRSKDDVIIAAMRAAARTKTSTASLPAGQQVVVGTDGLTKAKIIQARKIFRANEADAENGEQLFWAYGSEQMEDLLGDTTLTSADYMTVKMLQEGGVARSWMGFTWVPTERLAKSGTTRYNLAWAKSGVTLGIGSEIKTRITERADKSYAAQPYASMSLGAVRVEEEKVVVIECKE